MFGDDVVDGVKMERVKLFLSVFLDIKKDDVNPLPSTEAFQTLVTKVICCIHHLEQLSVVVHDLPVGVGGSRDGLSALKFFDTHHLKCNLQRHPTCSGARHLKGGSIKIDPLALVQAIEKYLVIRGHARVKMHSTTSSNSNNNNASTTTTASSTQQQHHNNTSIVGSDEDYDDEDDLSDDDDDDEDDLHNTFATLHQQHQQHFSRSGNFSQQHKHSQQQQHLLEFIINNNIIPHNITVYEAIKKFSQHTAQSDLADVDTASSFSHSSIWTTTHNIYFRLASDSTTATTITSSSSSYHHKLNKHNKKNKNNSKHKPKTSSKNYEELALSHYTNIHHPLLASLNPTLPSLTIHDPSTPLLPLLSTLHAINHYWSIIHHNQTNATTPHTHHTTTTSTPLIDHHHFTSSKLTSKATRQLQDPLAVVTSTFPSWLLQIAATCPFLLPFETRQHLFYSTAFDRERAIGRLQREFQHDNHTDHTDHRVLPRLEKKKCTVSRGDILRQADKIFNELHDPKVLLEVQFEGEVGTGLGPTLEFYALVSREMQRSDWSIWSGDLVEVTNENVGEKNKGFGGKGEKAEKSGRSRSKSSSSSAPPTLHYVHHPNGLFPSPLPLHTKSSHLNRVLSRFRLVGKVMAKALMDSRLLDLPLNPALYQWLLAHNINNNNEGSNNNKNNNNTCGGGSSRNTISKSVDGGSGSSNNTNANHNKLNNNTTNNNKALLSIDDLARMDSTVHRFMEQLLQLVHNKHAINHNNNLSSDEKCSQVKSLLLDGCSLEELSLNFCVPGHPMVEMMKGGRDEWLDVHNVEQYVKLSLEWLLQLGPERQLEALKEGFESLIPLTSLNIFYPHELDTLFCGNPFEAWTPQHLSIYCRVDHGFDLSSAPVQFLFQVLHSFTAQQQRMFLQFSTGSPRLPVGGLKSLSPSLTIVRKSIGAQEDADLFLPSVMTCANYLKLPHYSSLQVTRSKLLTAISEGQKSFHLS